tara:strand:+ start:976 stop:1926 length:951 start_codon:yes stop_codon:yes gene_type:complete
MAEVIHSKLLILGSGPAGYTAAIYASRAMLDPILLTGIEPGGQMTITTDVENYPGFADIVQGPWLMDQMKEQAESVGTRILFDTIVKVDLSKRPYELISDSKKIYSCDALIIATGAQAKWLGLKSEEKYKGYGVSACATCDGFFYKDQEVSVVGGGNTAAEEAIFLTNFASKVNLIHRRDSLRAEKILQNRLMENKKINIIWDSEVDEIIGNDNPLSVNGIVLVSKKTKEKKKILTNGVFIAIGHSPSSLIFKDQLKMNENGYIDTAPDSTKTNLEGVFAAGDVTDEKYRQAVTAAGMGCMAALEAESYLSEQEKP